mgnify:CR=1 FL=1
MAIIIGVNPRAERQEPVALPKTEISEIAEPAETVRESVAQSEEPAAETVTPVKAAPKKPKRNGKKK